MAYSIDYINLICTDLGGTGGHAYEIDGLNEICTLIGATAGHSYNIDALNAICTALGYTAGHEYNIDALNAIYVGGAYVYEDDAWQAIQVGSKFNQNFLLYKKRVETDGGTLTDTAKTLNIIKELTKLNLFDNIDLAWFAGMGAKYSTTSEVDYISKLYSLEEVSDLVQSTATNKPILSLNKSLLNPNRDLRYFSHSKLAYTVSDDFTITLIVESFGSNDYSSGLSSSLIIGEIVNGSYLAMSGSGLNAVNFKNNSGASQSISVSDLQSKYTVITLKCEGNALSLYLNGILFEAYSINTDFETDSLFVAVGLDAARRFFRGDIAGYMINKIALTDTQIRGICEMIYDHYDDSVTVEGIEFINKSTDLILTNSHTLTLIADGTTDAVWTTGAAAWCYHSNVLGRLAGKMYNKSARDLIIAYPPFGYRVATEADLTAIASLGSVLKSSKIWTTIDGNDTGFAAIGGGSRNVDGSFNAMKESVSFWCADSDKVLKIEDNGTVSIIDAAANEGHYIRFVKELYPYYPMTQLPANNDAASDFDASTVTYAELTSAVDALVTAYPTEISKTELGKDASDTYTISKYNLATTGTGSKGNILIYANEHGPTSDPRGASIIVYRFIKSLLEDADTDSYLAYLRENFNLIFIPILNPWGYDNNSRLNANGVNLNRNYNAASWASYTGEPKGSAPFSEVETAYIRDLCTVEEITHLLDIHELGGDYVTSSKMILYSPISDVRTRFATLNKYIYAKYITMTTITNDAGGEPMADVWASENGMTGVLIEFMRFNENERSMEHGAWSMTANYALLMNVLKTF